MKQVLHKIMSSLLAIVVLFSTMSFAIDMHYCGGTLIDIAMYHKAETCGMEIDINKQNVDESSCCSDEQIVIEAQDELQITLDFFSLDQHLFITSYVYSFISLFEDIEENTLSYSKYNPPLVVKDIFKLDETYLI